MWVRIWLCICVCVCASVCVCACGGASQHGYVKGDGDSDNDNSNHDDRIIRSYGHAADPVETRAVASLVSSYYSAAVAREVGSVCALVDPATGSEGFPEGFVLELIAPEALRREHCDVVLAAILTYRHKLLVDERASVKLTSVRVRGTNGFALLAFRMMPERVIPVVRVRGHWMVDTLLPSEIA